MIKFLRLTSLAAPITSALLAAAACSGENPAGDFGSESTEDSASIAMNLDLAPGVTVNSANYTITGPNGFTRSGSLELSNASALSAIIGGIPAGNGYSISATLTSVDGSVGCSGSASFNVSARSTTAVTVHMACHEAPRTGSVSLNGNINLCPVVDAAGANPAQVVVGGGIRLTGAAHDPDSSPSALTYAWSATSGVFDNATSQNPLFTCSLSGPVSITLTVSDGDAAPTCPDNLTVQVNCDPPPPQPYSWVVLGSGGAAIARVITPAATCPNITVDGVAQAMSVRAAAATIPVRTATATPTKASAFPVTTCEFTLPSGAHRASVLGHDLALPKANPQKIVIIGDTGCRLKTGNPWQACSDSTQWPFQRVADAAAAIHPDLVLHVGDYHYRENACPPEVTGCQGSPWSYGFDTWEADLFRPASSLLAAAPWVMVRGNHEECLRAGQGWFRFLDTRPFSEDHSCNLPANDTIANFNEPYAVPVGSDTQFIVFDTARAGANPLNPMNATDAPIFNTYQAELRQAAALASNPNVFSIFTNHHPILAYAPVAGGTPLGGLASLLSVMSSTYPVDYFPPNIGLAIHGHVHDFQGVNFASHHPPAFVAGMGGDNLDAALPDPFPFSVSPAPGAIPDMIAHDNAFGFMTMEREGGAWKYKAYKLDGTVLTTCSISAGDKLSCSNTGYLH
ncbi:MAG: metallophosphoesterase [Pseudomonadota bacterium]